MPARDLEGRRLIVVGTRHPVSVAQADRLRERMARDAIVIDRLGDDKIIWASDYPHPDAKFPGVTEELEEALAGLTHEQKRAITSESAIALYGIS